MVIYNWALSSTGLVWGGFVPNVSRAGVHHHRRLRCSGTKPSHILTTHPYIKNRTVKTNMWNHLLEPQIKTNL